MLELELCAYPHANQIHIDDFTKFFYREVPHHTQWSGDSSEVAKEGSTWLSRFQSRYHLRGIIDPAEFLDSLVDGMLDIFLFGHVGSDRYTLEPDSVRNTEQEDIPFTFAPNFSTASLPSWKVLSSPISINATPLAPSLAKDCAMALPSPRAPPVMNATPGAMAPLRLSDIVISCRSGSAINRWCGGTLYFFARRYFLETELQ